MRMLIATNGSPDCEDVLAFGALFACKATEPPTILTVIPHPIDGPPTSVDALCGLAGRFFAVDVRDVRTRVRFGRLAEEAVREARAGKYDLVIVGEGTPSSRGRHLLRNLVAVHVVEQAPCSVAIVKGKRGGIHRILLCDSGANGPAAAWSPRTAPKGSSVSQRFVACLADVLGWEAEVTVLHVMSQISAGPGVRGKQLRACAEDLIREHSPEGEVLARDIQVLAGMGCRCRAVVRHGLVVDEILAEARGGDYDLVVIGAPSGESWSRFLLDDLAHRIVSRLDRPVLVVR
jgi:nucleotide-binding universal stress UspA family protein